jgi:two-component system chemotaxis response regulator CheY
MSVIDINRIQLNDLTVELTVESHQNFLILDDDEDINEMLVNFLEALGFNGKFLTANSINDAKRYLKYEKVDFILSDWNLPDGQGIAFLKAIRKSQKFHNIPFIMVTGQDDVESMITSSKIGSSEYITKPFDLETFKRKLIDGWKTHVIPDQKKVHALQNKIIELEEEIIKLKDENKKLNERLTELYEE